MKKRFNIITAIIVSLFILSCEKNAVQQIDYTPAGAFIRAYNFAVSGPTVNIYANDKKMTAIGSTTGIEAAAGISAYGVFPTTNSYLNLTTVGDVVFKAKVSSTATTNANIETTVLPTNVVAGKYYSFYTSGIYDATAKTTSSFILEDNFPSIDTAVSYVRLVNTISNAANGFNLVAVNTTTAEVINIAAATAYKAGSAFVKVPNGVYNLTAVSVNTPANITITRAAVSFSKGLVYTIAARGSTTTTSTLALDLTRNR
ncbi:hypothetical protein [Pedobacter sp. SL55]|uniref:hypothetical protein n=1 Tax=Pedobacter sp. SL55 TaxID=2995161 RepID=UPI00227038C9|nr:hypothetical protein [Pedobacter sp. SL55]WAC41930.1 hypothetical protein OVA16_06115 [Pedobacter sp. SL55]